MRSSPFAARCGLGLVVVAALGCHSKGPSSTAADAGVDAGPPFQSISALSSVSKIKGLLTGLAPTDDEVAAVAADGGAMQALVAQWVTTPQYTGIMQSFFATAFQQSQALSTDYENQGTVGNGMVAGLNQSFALTVLELIKEGKPFTDVYTTQRFMLTPALMAQYAYLDEAAINDNGTLTDSILKNNANFTFTLVDAGAAGIPLSQTLDSTSPNYMMWGDPNLGAIYDSECPSGSAVYTTQKHQQSIIQSLFQFLIGTPGYFVVSSPSEANGVHKCYPPTIPTASRYITGTDYTQWSMVNIRQPMQGEQTTVFYDLDSIRSATELVLNTQRVGFFTTPSFFAQWQTNASNQARVTLNQTLITGLGKEVDPTNVSTPPSEQAEDAAHAVPGSPCYGCHMALDPMRQFFRQDYSLYFSPQTDAGIEAIPGSFGFLGVSTGGNSIIDLATILSTHPRVAAAWTQKLCTWANSLPCAEDDPRFIQIASDFEAGNFNWTNLVIELMSSPMVTYVSPSQNVAENGETFPIARQEQLCAVLSNRLGVTDVCGLLPTTVVPSRLRPAQTIAGSLPSDAYGRGAEIPILANNPSLTYRAGLENLCASLANQLIDYGTTPVFSSSNSGTAIASFVHNLMGIPPSQDTMPMQILQAHFNNAEAMGSTATTALQSTFVVACLSPAVAGVGQ